MAQAFLNGVQYSDPKLQSVALFVERSATEIDVPEGITKIGYSAFYGCTEMERVTLPESITYIDYYAFANCRSLKEIIIPKEVTNILSAAFQGCKALTEIIIPPKTTVLNTNLFKSCNSLEKVVSEAKITRILNEVFGGCSACLVYDFTACSSVTRLDHANAFTDINENAKIFVPNSLYRNWKEATNWVSVADHIFPGPSEGLEYEYYSDEDGYMVKGVGSFEGDLLVIPESYDGPMGEKAVVGISADDFVNNDQITFLYMPESAKYIHGPCFDSCAKLEKVYIPGVRGIPSFEFLNLSSLQYVEFGKNINYIGGGAFGGSRDVVFDFSRAETVPELYSYGAGMEFGVDPRIIVPQSLYEDWINATNWTIYEKNIVT